MIYLDPTPNPSGAYPNPKLQPFPGGIPLEGEGEKLFFQYNGFVTLEEDGSVTPNTQAWEEWKGAQSDPLAQAREEKIAQSKADLAAYLAAHPLLWTDGQHYSITAEKQAQLTSKLAVAQAKAAMGVPYELKWNTTEEVCVPWELSDLYDLAFAIDQRVTALVSYQQEKEVEIRSAETQEVLDAIEVDYDTVQ